MALNLTKVSENITLNLTKRNLVNPGDINVSLLLDYSGSMDHLYRNGTVTEMFKQILGVGNVIDDDGQLLLIPFTEQTVTEIECDAKRDFDRADRIIADLLVKHHMGGTNFGPVLNSALCHFSKSIDELRPVITPAKKEAKGFFGRLKEMFTGGDEEVVQEIQDYFDPSKMTIEGKQLFILITDGDNWDNEEFNRITKMIDQLPNVFLQLVSLNYVSNKLKHFAQVYPNSVNYTNYTTGSSDEQLIEAVVSAPALSKLG